MSEAAALRKPPRGIRKGGTRFPRYSLKDALPWAKKLVSKTHLGPEPRDVIFAGVVGSTSTTGEIKVSALKQFNLLEGTAKAYSATQLARAIASAPAEELPPLLRQAALAPDVFEALFRTFHSDEVTVAKLKQRAADLKVHPDETERCVKLYVESLEVAGLVEKKGDVVQHVMTQGAPQDASILSDDEIEIDVEENAEVSAEVSHEDVQSEKTTVNEGEGRPRAVFNVNISLDSSLDTEKLEKQLKLLKRYGAI